MIKLPARRLRLNPNDGDNNEKNNDDDDDDDDDDNNNEHRRGHVCGIASFSASEPPSMCPGVGAWKTIEKKAADNRDSALLGTSILPCVRTRPS